MADSNSTGASAPELPKHPFIADTLAETVLNIDSLLAVVEVHFDAHPDGANYFSTLPLRMRYLTSRRPENISK